MCSSDLLSLSVNNLFNKIGYTEVEGDGHAARSIGGRAERKQPGTECRREQPEEQHRETEQSRRPEAGEPAKRVAPGRG